MFKQILVETRDRIGIITLNRPEAMNALSQAMMEELARALQDFEEKGHVSCILLKGTGKTFAAGVDIKEMSRMSHMDALNSDFLTKYFDRLSLCPLPVVGAVSGYALGGGCELALMCDILIAARSAKFSQPEVTLGTMPGIGATQRLSRLMGKHKAMDLCLTARVIDALEAEKLGMISRLVDDENWEEEALCVAQQISQYSRPVLKKIKAAINSAFNIPLAAGIKVERDLFYSTFALDDRKEGMEAFLEKRKPRFENK